jgi:hypothetical protein
MGHCCFTLSYDFFCAAPRIVESSDDIADAVSDDLSESEPMSAAYRIAGSRRVAPIEIAATAANYKARNPSDSLDFQLGWSCICAHTLYFYLIFYGNSSIRVSTAIYLYILFFNF